ncbi:MAG: FG-GAP repeat domain-containing protein [Phycisphaerae bacterium]
MMSGNRLTIAIVSVAFLAAAIAASVSTGCSPGAATSGGGSGNLFVSAGQTLSAFRAIQVDPPSEDSAGPQFVASADLNGDGLMDLVSAWNQSQPVQVHLQGRTADGSISFETTTLAGNIPAVSVAGIEVADFNLDDRPDIAVLVKISLQGNAGCLDSNLPPDGTLSGLVQLYLGPTDSAQANQALAWQEVAVEISRLPAPESVPTLPELEGYTSMAIGDLNLDGAPDIVVASNISCDGQASDVLLFTNQGPSAIQDGTWRGEALPNPFPRTTIKDIGLGDIDGDGDLDIVATFPDAPSMNVRWFRNPTLDTPDDFHLSDGLWHVGAVAQISTGADILELGDINLDGILDVVVRSTNGRLIQWLQGPDTPTTEPVRSIAWRVFTVAEFTERSPDAMALVDLNFDGQLEVVASAQGGLLWFDSTGPATLFDQWTENLIIDDQTATSAPTSATVDPNADPNAVPEPQMASTLMNWILPVDLNGDGANDLVVPLDRSGLSGLTNDALVWFENLR